ncbi:MAG: hypothetical protein ABEJ76_05070 [Halanaeroarchaeum sp.]
MRTVKWTRAATTDEATVTQQSLADRVLAVVRYNTGGPQPPTVDATHVKTVLCSGGGPDPDRVEAVLQTLVTNGDVVETDGRYRLPEDP